MPSRALGIFILFFQISANGDSWLPKDNIYLGKGLCFIAPLSKNIKKGDSALVYARGFDPRKTKIASVLKGELADKIFSGKHDESSNVLDNSWVDMTGCWQEGLANYQIVAVAGGPQGGDDSPTVIIHGSPRGVLPIETQTTTLSASKSEELLKKADKANLESCIGKGNRRLIHGRRYGTAPGCAITEVYLGAATVRSDEMRKVEACRFVFNGEKLLRVISFTLQSSNLPGVNPITNENWWNEKSEELWGFLSLGSRLPCRVVSTIPGEKGVNYVVRPADKGTFTEAFSSYDFFKFVKTQKD